MASGSMKISDSAMRSSPLMSTAATLIEKASSARRACPAPRSIAMIVEAPTPNSSPTHEYSVYIGITMFTAASPSVPEPMEMK